MAIMEEDPRMLYVRPRRLENAGRLLQVMFLRHVVEDNPVHHHELTVAIEAIQGIRN